jgi:hypothetical protein
MKNLFKFLLLATLLLMQTLVANAQNSVASTTAYSKTDMDFSPEDGVDYEIVSDVFPNPTATYFSFRFFGAEDAVLYIRLMNNMGLLVQDKLIVSPSSDDIYKIEINDLPAAEYTVSFRQGINTINQKLLIQK